MIVTTSTQAKYATSYVLITQITQCLARKRLTPVLQANLRSEPLLESPLIQHEVTLQSQRYLIVSKIGLQLGSESEDRST